MVCGQLIIFLPEAVSKPKLRVEDEAITRLTSESDQFWDTC